MGEWLKKLIPNVRWLKSGDGHEDPVLTMVWIGFLVIVFRVSVSDLTINVLHQTLAFKAIDPLVIGAFFAPLLTAFVANHYNNMKNNPFYYKMRKDIDGDGKEEDVIVPVGDVPVNDPKVP